MFGLSKTLDIRNFLYLLEISIVIPISNLQGTVFQKFCTRFFQVFFTPRTHKTATKIKYFIIGWTSFLNIFEPMH